MSLLDLNHAALCIWITAPGTTPGTIADTIVAVLNAVRPLAARRRLPDDKRTRR
jgi:hypothetical protein